jgi:Holliday junction resolvase RusA-like endonuclease
MALGLLDAVQAAPLRERAELSFFASGMPAPQGSKRAFRNSHTGRIQQVESSKKLPGWRSDVRDAVEDAMAGRQPFVAGALEVWLRFVFQRPAAHMSARGGLKPSAPAAMATGADVDKLARSVMDVLTGRAFTDDRQVASLHAEKVYGDRPGVHIVVRPLPPDDRRAQP